MIDALFFNGEKKRKQLTISFLSNISLDFFPALNDFRVFVSTLRYFCPTSKRYSKGLDDSGDG